MLRSDLELTADVVLYQLAHELVVLILHKIIVTDTGAYEHALDTLDLPYLPQKSKVFGVVDF